MPESIDVAGRLPGEPLLQRATKKAPCAVHAYDKSNARDTAIIPTDGSGIGVSSVADMVTKVNAHVDDPKNACSCLTLLEINGHGTDGYQSVGNGDQYVNDDKALVHDSKEAHLKKLSSIKFCGTGSVLLGGCHVGRGKGKILLGKLSKILPGKLIGGAKHYTGGPGLGKKDVAGAGDVISQGALIPGKSDPFWSSPYVRWHIVIGGKEYVINGAQAASTKGKAKLSAGEKIKVKTPDKEIKVK